MEVQYVELSNRRETKEQIEASLEGVKSGYLQSLKNSRGRLLHLLRLSEGGYQFDSIIPLHDGTPVQNRTRVYVLGSRQYTISCGTWNNQGLDEALAGRFLNSFSFVNASAKPADKTSNKNLNRITRRTTDRNNPKP